jgi:hypothetical protein
MSPQGAGNGNAVRMVSNARGASVSRMDIQTGSAVLPVPEMPGFMADCNPLLARARCILGCSFASCAAAG